LWAETRTLGQSNLLPKPPPLGQIRLRPHGQVSPDEGNPLTEVERLDAKGAGALGLDPDRVSYTALADLATATDKARRDAPAIAVCDV
jgi:hypothetical protein